jgi:hypothetical protein
LLGERPSGLPVYSRVLVVAAAAVLFSLADPSGDALGDGGYRLPAGAEEQAVDLRSFTAIDDEGRLRFRLGLGRVASANSAPNGFADTQLDVFVSGPDGERSLGGSGFMTAQGSGWRYHVSANGWSANFTAAGTAQSPSGETRAHVEGSDVVIETPIPVGEYRYWAMVSLFDPLSQDGLRRPLPGSAPFELAAAREGMPAALDVLAEGDQTGHYASLVLPSVGPDLERSRYLLVAGIAGAVLALGATVWGLFRR